MPPLDPTEAQLKARLNPTPSTMSLPGEGVFRSQGDFGTMLFKKNADSTLSQYNLADSPLFSQEERGKFSAGDLGYEASKRLKEQYGLDYGSLPSIHLGDYFQSLASNAGRPGGVAEIKGGNLGQYMDAYRSVSNNLNDFIQQRAAPVTAQTINNTPNTLGTFKEDPNNPTATAQTLALQKAAGAPAGASNGATFPGSNLQPGMQGDEVKKLQDYLVSQGLMTREQVNTGYGTYGPQTTAAVQALQQKLGVDNSSGPGYFGPKTLAALQGQMQGGAQAPVGGATGGLSGGATGIMGSSLSSSMPTGAPTFMPPATSNTDSYFNELLKYLKPGAEETNLQAQGSALDATLRNLNQGQGVMNANLEDQPIALPFITGQQSAVEKRYALQRGDVQNQQQTLQQKLANEQAKRQSAIDVSKTALDYQMDKNKLASDAQGTAFDQSFKLKQFEEDKRQFGLEYAQQQQKIANDKAGSGGLTPGQTTAFNAIVAKYNASPLIQAADRTAVLKNAITDINKDPNDAALQLNLAYAYIQALDTYQSAVREGELSLVNSIDSKIGQFGNSISQITNGQIVRPEVAKQIAEAAGSIVSTINTAAQRKAESFKSQANTVGLGSYWGQYIGGFEPSYGGSGGGSGSTASTPADIENDVQQAIKRPDLYPNRESLISALSQAHGISEGDAWEKYVKRLWPDNTQR